jgi:hypothetical protein
MRIIPPSKITYDRINIGKHKIRSEEDTNVAYGKISGSKITVFSLYRPEKIKEEREEDKGRFIDVRV